MKTKYIVLIMSLLHLLIIILALILAMLPEEKEIENMKYFRFSYTTGYHMNASVSYEIELIDGKYIAKIKPTDIPEEDAQTIEISENEVKTIENKLSEYHVSLWNGFHKSDKNVLDGNSFSLSIRYKNNDSISASGYMMWPNNYREVRDYLDNKLGSLYKKD